MIDKHRRSLPNWFTQPSSWLSLIATFVSVGTFLLVYVHSGQLKVFLSDRIGATHARGTLELLVPFTVSNTGAPRTQRHVLLATIALHERQPIMQRSDMIWIEEYRILNKYEYEAKYQGKSASSKKSGKAGQTSSEGNSSFERMDYVNRAFPFALWGGNSISKVMTFREKLPTFKGNRLNEFDVILSLKTEGGTFEVSSTYRCADEELPGGFIECRDVSAWQ